MSPELRQMYEQHAIDEQTIELLQEANVRLRKVVESAAAADEYRDNPAAIERLAVMARWALAA